MAALTHSSLQHRLRHLGLNLISFNVCYLLANALAQQQAVTRHLVLPFERDMPFLPWMIVPYFSLSGLLGLSFVWLRSADQVRVLSQRLLLATVLAAFVFLLAPLQFSGTRPWVAPPLDLLYDVLAVVDRPYNQLPSLHVTYGVILWASLRQVVGSPMARVVLALWLLLTASATLLTYQHHVMDVLAGGVLGVLCVRSLPHGRTEPHVGFYYLMAAALTAWLGGLVWHSGLALYLSLSLLLVSLAYYRGDRLFLHKRAGRFPLRTWLLYGPYLIGYWLTWQAVRWRERDHPAIQSLTAQLWVGRRLTAAQARQLPPDCTVIDLANELSETASLRRHRYMHFPLLDLVTPPPEVRQQILSALVAQRDAGRPVYLHCAMGYSRCRLLADDFLRHSAT